MTLRILYVAYPMFPISASVPGGAEQVLWTLEREMAARGHSTAVATCRGSQVAGRAVATGVAPIDLDAFEERKTQHEDAVIAEVQRAQAAGDPYDIVHDMSGSFWERAREVNAPVLATLHLPKTFYWRRAFDAVPSNVCFNCVSLSQQTDFEDIPHLLGVINNGIRVKDFPVPDAAREDYLLWIGRICEEKGPHIAIEVARRAGLPIILAGEVYRFSYHQQFFEREIWPRVDDTRVKRVGRLSFADKLKLLSRARALLVTSSVPETSSLVAMEAMACGTPVVAFNFGALPEIVADGVTGFLVNNADEMIGAIGQAGKIDPNACREQVELNYPAARMAQEYEQMYARLIRMASGTSTGASA